MVVQRGILLVCTRHGRFGLDLRWKVSVLAFSSRAVTDILLDCGNAIDSMKDQSIYDAFSMGLQGSRRFYISISIKVVSLSHRC